MEISDKKDIKPFSAGRTKQTRLEYLEEGRRFEVVGLEDIFRNLYLIRSSSCSCLVRGEKKDGINEDWTQLGHNAYMALSTVVKGL